MAEPKQSAPQQPASLPAEPTRLRRAANMFVVALFLAATTVPMTQLLRPGVDKLIEATENRRVAVFPNTEGRWHGPLWIPRKGTLQEFPNGFEAWFNDHLGARRSFIQLRNLALIAGLTSDSVVRPMQGQARNTQVIIGREGWLFSSTENLVDDYRCARPLTEAELDQWQQVLEERRNWLARRGIRYLVMIAPNSQTIYGEYMPRAITRVHEHSRMDQLLGRLRDKTDLVALDPRSRLIAGKANWPTYHKTDTHWNDYGAFLAYGQLCEALQAWYPQLRPKQISDYTVTMRESEGLELSRVVDSIVRFSEQLVTLTPEQPRQAQSVGQLSQSAGEARLTVNPNGELNRVVVLHDSFFWALWPFLSEHWQRARYAKSPDFPTELIEQEQPDVVIQEFVERRLMIYEPKNSPQVVAEQQFQQARRTEGSAR